MTDLITIQLRRELPNGEEFVYQYQITEITAEKDADVGVVFQYHFAQFMAEYDYLKDNLNKEKDE